MASKDKNPRQMNLNDLQKIHQVDTPAFLWTRIEARITQYVEERVSKKQLIAYLASLVILISINVFAFRQSDSKSSNSLTEQLELVESNQFY